MRIVSFLPAATEIACALGLGDALVGVTAECDHPPEVRGKPAVVRPGLPFAAMSPGEIDAAVGARGRAGGSLYTVDEALLHDLRPDLILAQDLCQVCAPSGSDAAAAVRALPVRPRVLYLTPRRVDEVWANILAVGEAAGVPERARALVEGLRARMDAIAARAAGDGTRPRVFVMEWTDPVWASGHWTGELVSLAGGRDPLAPVGEPSVRVSWERVIESAPEVLIVSPCGLPLDAARREAERLRGRKGWSDLPAARNGRVFAVDANGYLTRPGPRLADGLGLLAELLHPETCRGEAPAGSWSRVGD